MRVRNYLILLHIVSHRTRFAQVRDFRIFRKALYRARVDCSWIFREKRVKRAPPQNLLSYSVAERKRLNLGNLNPIYERELNKPDVGNPTS